jgi:hypothetical protein
MSKHNGTIEFSSKQGLFFFKTARVLARLSFFCGIISGMLFVGRDIEAPKPTVADAAPTIVLFGFWLLLKILMNLRIAKGMRDAASSRGIPYRQYKAKTRSDKFGTTLELSGEAKYPKTKRGQLARHQDALDLFYYKLRQDMQAVKTVRRNDRDLDYSNRELRAAQEKGQSIVDRNCREYAVGEYAARNDVTPMQVNEMLRNENGRGPVTKAVKEHYDFVHYEYKAYFEQWENSFKGAWQGYAEKQGVGGTKKKFYDRKY